MEVDTVLYGIGGLASSILSAYAISLINSGEKKRDSAREESNELRSLQVRRLDDIEKKLDNIDKKVDHSISTLATQTRSDIVHKCHRYLDDLGMASTEEKEALHDEHKQYGRFCKDLGIDNGFIDNLVEQVMNLPNRPREDVAKDV